MLSRAAKALYRRYYGNWPKSKRYGSSPITARPKAMMSFLGGTTGYPGGHGLTRGYKCGPLPASSGRKRY